MQVGRPEIKGGVYMRTRINLNGAWEYEPLAFIMLQADGGEKTVSRPLPGKGTMQIPGNWHYSGLPDFYGRVRFLRRFHSVPVEGKRAYLCFGGGDYSCRIFLNGRLAGSHEGCFQSFEVEVTPWLAANGDQELAVEVFSPNEEPGSVWPHKKRLIKGILSHWDGKQGSWDPERGQDGNTGGIWGDVSLEYRSDVHISSVSLHTQLLPKVKKEGAFFTDWGEKEGIDDTPKAYVWITADLRGAFPAGKNRALRLTLTGEDGASVEKIVTIGQ
jgi:beta-mannosidase